MCRGSGSHDSLPLWRREGAQHRSSSADFLCQLAHHLRSKLVLQTIILHDR
ncbi:hypothetical protein M422DRAFT_258108 [Sphaerobolus stellatus SS14]|uniref:Uncharacterized protein n=1 Tax=Sphaerobolus stellatus (strain SS14) TaxID=990650 RepID=A0A0C9UWH7_SPHS4|nr:hypothetical protein M422DRAFT_258108 [Sphaerobolus stellatus SS14]